MRAAVSKAPAKSALSLKAGGNKSKSEDLSKTVKFDEREGEDDYTGYNDDDDGEEERNEQEMIDAERSEAKASLWENTSREMQLKKGKLLQRLVLDFSMIIRREDEPDEDGNPVYTKLHSAVDSIRKIYRTLSNYEDGGKRKFSLFIAKKGWVEKILVPLIEVSFRDDRDVVEYGCVLLMRLTQQLSESSRTALNFDAIKAKADGKDPDDIDAMVKAKNNAREQLSALLSFKDVLSGERCLLAMVTSFARAWRHEILLEASDDKSKLEMRRVLKLVSNLLSIQADPLHSSPGEVIKDRSVHQRLVVNLRTLLFVLPGMLGDLNRKTKGVGERYHDSHLNDMLRILCFALRGQSARDMFAVWREGGLLGGEDSPYQAGSDASFESVMPVVVPVAIQQRHVSATRGLLGDKLKAQRNERKAALGAVDSRSVRFGGVLVKPLVQRAAAPSGENAANADKNSSGAATGKPGPLGDDDDDDPAASAMANAMAPMAQAKAQVYRGANMLSTNRSVPQAPVRRSKKSITFATEGGTGLAEAGFGGGGGRGAESSALSNRQGQEACVVAASLVDMIIADHSLNSIILRVNEDLRRDENVIRDDMELNFFEIVSSHLQYGRLKLSEERLQFLRDKEAGLVESAQSDDPLGGEDALGLGGWSPDFRFCINAFDKMSLHRTLTAMEVLHKKKAYLDIARAMELYKEIVCYQRLMLESSNPGHHDLAVHTLYRLFYNTTERKDPLGRLLSEWRPNTYSRRHLNVLVELVHETMKTLEAAQAIYSAENSGMERQAAARARRSRQGGANVPRASEVDLWVSCAIRFNVDEYFKRLVSNSTVRLYTKLLDQFATNSPTVNFYVSTFLQRMCAFKLEQQYPAPPPAPTKPAESSSSLSRSSSMLPDSLHGTPQPQQELSLMFMLFNVSTLTSFLAVLSDPLAARQSHMAPLLSLIRSVVRRFGEAAAKNHLLYCEALFRQPHPHLFCEKVDNVYEAQAYRIGMALSGYDDEDDRPNKRSEYEYDSGSEEEEGAGEGQGDDQDQGQGQVTAHVRPTKPNLKSKSKPQAKATSGGGGDDSEGEFDPSAPVRAISVQELKQKEKMRRRQERQHKNGGSDGGDDADDDNDNNKDDDGSEEEDVFGSRTKAKRRGAGRGGASRGRRAPTWTAAEDALLKRLFELYKGTAGCFFSISQDEDMIGFGYNRSVDAISRRVKELRLHELQDGDDSDGDATQPEFIVKAGSRGGKEINLGGSDESEGEGQGQGEGGATQPQGNSDDDDEATQSQSKQSKRPKVLTSSSSSASASPADGTDREEGQGSGGKKRPVAGPAPWELGLDADEDEDQGGAKRQKLGGGGKGKDKSKGKDKGKAKGKDKGKGKGGGLRRGGRAASDSDSDAAFGGDEDVDGGGGGGGAGRRRAVVDDDDE